MQAYQVNQETEEQTLDVNVLGIVHGQPGITKQTLKDRVARYMTSKLEELTGMDHEVVLQHSLGRLTAKGKIFVEINKVPF